MMILSYLNLILILTLSQIFITIFVNNSTLSSYKAKRVELVEQSIQFSCVPHWSSSSSDSLDSSDSLYLLFYT